MAKIRHASQACRLAKRVSLNMISKVAHTDNPTYYDECVALGKKARVTEIAEAAVPVEEEA